jgi:chromosome segregation ATPase
VVPAPHFEAGVGRLLAKEAKPKVDAEEQAFDKAVSDFQQRLEKLPPKHKAQIRQIHSQVDAWADEKRDAGQRADKLSTFVGKVMRYADKHLANLEKADPKLLQFKAEHKQFQELFLAGNEVIESYLAWIRTDYPRRPPAKQAR